METDVGAAYRIRLRSLEWSTGLVRELRHSEDVEAVSVAANWALDAVYDLFEVYMLAAGLRAKLPAQDELLALKAGEKVGGLLFVRGEKTHHARRVEGPSPFSELPYAFADLTNWTWTQLTTTEAAFERRARWYGRHVHNRPLWVPFDEASYWFVANSPIEIPGQNLRNVPGWVESITAICATDLREPSALTVEEVDQGTTTVADSRGV